jgi:uncharacterized protein (DUF1330 family)
MTKGYWIILFREIKDPIKVEAYRNIAGPALLAAGAKFLLRGMPSKTYEMGKMERAVVIEFESVEKAIEVYESPGYQSAMKALGDGAERDVRIVEGT